MTNTGGKEKKMKRLLKNKKALSPVVAAIILIAVTVAVSIAVAAWMGSLTIGFMETAEVTITDVEFFNPGTGNDYIDVSLINTGTSAATVGGAKVNGVSVTIAVQGGASSTLAAGAGSDTTFRLTDTSINSMSDGTKYSISIFANDGSLLSSHTETAYLQVPAS